MRLLITFEPLQSFSSDVVYKHTVQGFVYSLLKETELSSSHDRAGFKFFTFSDIFPLGDFNIGQERNILISSPRDEFIDTLLASLIHKETLLLGGNPVKIKRFKRINLKLTSRFTSASPIALYKSNRENIYYSFEKDRDLGFFLNRLKENALKKFNAFFGENYTLEGNIFDRLIFKKEVAIRNIKGGKEFLIIGSSWRLLQKLYIHEYERKFYQFIMDCGLGEKNSLGFGFVNPVR